MRIRSLGALALAVLVVPSSAQEDLRLEKAFDDSLLSPLKELVATYAELETAGLLENQTIVVLPPLRIGVPGDRDARNQVTRTTQAGDRLADYLGRRLRQELPRSTVVFGSDVESRFKNAGVSLTAYSSQATGLELANDLRAGFIIAGRLNHESGSRNETFVAELRGRRPGKDVAADWTPSRVTVATRGGVGYRDLDAGDQEPSAVPFGNDPRAKALDPTEDELIDLADAWLEASLGEVAESFRAFIEVEAAEGRVTPPGDGDVAVLPVQGTGGESTGLGDRIGYALGDAFDSAGPDGLLESLDEAARRDDSFDMSLGEVVAYGLTSSGFERLRIQHLIRASYKLRSLRTKGRRMGGQLILSLSAADAEGGFVARTFRIEVGSGALAVKDWLDEESELAFEPARLDPERILRDELRELMPRTLQNSGLDLKASSLRLLPLETPQTGSMLEAFGVVRGQLSRARADVARRADEAGVPVAEAIKSTEFAVKIDVLEREFETFEAARRTLMNLCWANLALSEPFALGNRLTQDYRVDVSKLAPRLQASPASLVALDLELNQGRSTSQAATEEVDEFLLADPDFVLTARWIPQGERSSLIARVFNFADPGTPVRLERVELSRAKTEAIESIMGEAKAFSGSEALKK
ncbi:MAG: hypothetical protein AAGG01_14945, partial [Planctomycetota bacterium]